MLLMPHLLEIGYKVKPFSPAPFPIKWVNCRLIVNAENAGPHPSKPAVYIETEKK